MKLKRFFLARGVTVLAALALLATLGVPRSAWAQTTTGTVGLPGATTTLDGKQLPPPDPKFGGVIKEKASESKAWWAPRVRTVWAGPELGAGKHTIVFDFKSDGPGLGKGGTGVLSVDGKEVARNSIEHGTPITFPEDETFDIGSDTRTGVALLEYRYDVPFTFTGTINKLTFNLEPAQLTAEEREKMKKAVASARD